MLRIPAAPSQIPSSGICAAAATCCLAFSPLPGENGRKLVGDWGGTTHVSFRFGKMLLVNSCTILYTSAEIPPAGAPPTNRVRSRTLQIPRTSRRIPKTSLHGNRRFQNREKFADQNGGCRAGKFGEGQGGLEGRETPPKGVSLRLQGLPFLPPTSTSTSMSSSDSIAPWFCGGGKPQRRSKAPCRPQRI